MAAAVNVYMKLPIVVRTNGGRYTATCFLLDEGYEGATKHDALDALTRAAQAYISLCYRERRLDALLALHDLRVQNAAEEVTSGRYIDVAVHLKAPD